ncbi:MAG: NitT/TauT family transport system substrate-binding protein [bacterium]|jgi:ABC-type nitrate/sulfonate/bicarbonate transport system substrate-binding protein
MADTEQLDLALYCTQCMPGYHLPCFAGGDDDIFERHGLSIRIFDPEGGPANPAAVAAGRLDLCLTSVAHFLAAKRENPQLQARFVFMVARQSHMAAFVARGRPAAHGRPIETYADLDGATLLGDPDSPFGREYRALLSRLGARGGESVNVPYESIMQALADGRGDVAADFADLLPRFREAAAPHGVQVDALPFHDAGIDIYGSGLVASTRLLAERPATARAAVRAFREALQASRDDPRRGLRGLLDHIPTADADAVLAGWSAGAPIVFDAEPSALGTMTVEKWQRTIDYHADAYGGSRDIDVHELFDGAPLAADHAAAAR